MLRQDRPRLLTGAVIRLLRQVEHGASEPDIVAAGPLQSIESAVRIAVLHAEQRSADEDRRVRVSLMSLQELIQIARDGGGFPPEEPGEKRQELQLLIAPVGVGLGHHLHDVVPPVQVQEELAPGRGRHLRPVAARHGVEQLERSLWFPVMTEESSGQNDRGLRRVTTCRVHDLVDHVLRQTGDRSSSAAAVEELDRHR